MCWWLECFKTIKRAITPSPRRAPPLEFTSRIDAPRPCRTPSRGGVLLVYLLKAICVKVFIGGVTCSVEVCPEHVAARQKLSPRTLKIAVPPRCATTERMNPH
jgi:hypothetical protein